MRTVTTGTTDGDKVAITGRRPSRVRPSWSTEPIASRTARPCCCRATRHPRPPRPATRRRVRKPPKASTADIIVIARAATAAAANDHPAFRVKRAAMNPSRPFILAPGRDLAADDRDHAGRPGRAISYLPLSALPEVDYPTIQVQTFLPGASPRCDDHLGHRAAGTPVRPDAGPQGDVVGQLGRRLGHHAAVRSEPQPRRRRTGSAGGDQRRRATCCRRPCPRRRSTPRSIRPTRRS